MPVLCRLQSVQSVALDQNPTNIKHENTTATTNCANLNMLHPQVMGFIPSLLRASSILSSSSCWGWGKPRSVLFAPTKMI